MGFLKTNTFMLEPTKYQLSGSDLLRLIEASLLVFGVSLFLTKADFLRGIRAAVDRTYQGFMLLLRMRTFHSPATCFLCVSFSVSAAVSFYQDGLTMGAALNAIRIFALSGILSRI